MRRALAASMTIIVFILSIGRDTYAFHNGGVGPCEGCHSMHNSSGGISPGVPHAYLLKEQDPGSTCLYCHEKAGDTGPTTFHVSTPAGELQQKAAPKQLTPGGDFGWLNKTFSWVTGLGLPVQYSRGEHHGHNIVARDFAYDTDSTNPTAPGGTYPSGKLSCISCHDPHGKYRRNDDGSITTSGKPIGSSGSFASNPDPGLAMSVGVYRLLAGRNYRPKSLIGGFAFANDPPAAVAPGNANRSEATTQTRVAYGSGMSEWCMNCHPTIHTPLSPGINPLIHSSGVTAKFGSLKADNYNKYVKTGDLSGMTERSYLSLVPFEEGTTDYSLLKTHARTDDTYLAGPDRTTAQVSCITCHRAHASGWDGAMRWNAGTEYTVFNGYYAQEGQQYQPYGQGRSESEAKRAYYERPSTVFNVNQDSLCNKCHIGVYP